jgi:hypothetical protein
LYRNKYMIIERRVGAPPFKIPFQTCACRFVQRHES